MKRKGLLFLVLATLIAGGAFAQKVGDTVDFYGKKYNVKEMKDGSVLLQLALTPDGDWKNSGVGRVITIKGTTGTIKEVGSTTTKANDDDSFRYKSAVDKGYLKVGTQVVKNLKQSGDLTWTGQYAGITFNTASPLVATGTGWYDNVTFTLSADGKTFVDSASGTYTRQ
jgi:hypothetical protein